MDVVESFFNRLNFSTLTQEAKLFAERLQRTVRRQHRALKAMVPLVKLQDVELERRDGAGVEVKEQVSRSMSNDVGS